MERQRVQPMVSRRGLISHQRIEPTRADQLLAADHRAGKLERRVFSFFLGRLSHKSAGQRIWTLVPANAPKG